MKVQQLQTAGQPRWDELAEILERAKGRPHRLSSEEVLRFGALYRAATADLALMRRLSGADPSTQTLEKLVLRARDVLYRRVTKRASGREFLSVTYWQLIRSRSSVMLIAAGGLLAPAIVAYAWAVADPDAVAGLIPPDFLWVRDATSTDQGYGAVGLVGFSVYVMTNNIRVTLMAFALGATWGLGTAWLLIQNGLILGAVAGLAVQAGNTEVFLAAIAAHGVLELSCIVVGAGAGLVVGRAMLRPGTRTRRAALVAESLPAIKIAAGTLPWLVLAGVLEGFASRTGRGPVFAVLVGLAVGAGYWTLVLTRGRPRPSTG